MRRRLYFSIAWLVLTAWTDMIYGQTEQNITPVSPSAAALAKKVNYPINLNTGIPNISIPFYTLSVGGMTLPVKLEYHAGGFKINEHATRVGLGWSLSCNLQITRSINGNDDLNPNKGYIANDLMKAYNPDDFGSVGQYPIWSFLPWPYANAYDLAFGEKDGMPDEFNYQLLDKSGSFYFMKPQSGNGYSIVPVPFNNIKISYSNGQFIIVDTDGTTYYFGEQGPTGDISGWAQMGREFTGPAGISSGKLTAWKCMKIVNNTGTDQITFHYTAKNVQTYRTYQDYIEYYNNKNPCYIGGGNYYRSDVLPLSGIDKFENIPAPFYQISSPKYKEVYAGNYNDKFVIPHLDAMDNVVKKEYTIDDLSIGIASDVYGLALSEIDFRGGRITFNGIDKLSSIQVLDSKNNVIRSAALFQSYTQAQYKPEAKLYNGQDFNGTLYLDSLHINNGSNVYERYGLLYQDKFCYGNHLQGHDAWGYPNARTIEIEKAKNLGLHNTSIPTKRILQERFYRDIQAGCTNFAPDVAIDIGGGDWAEASDEEAMKRGILKRIIYPTGGFVDFDFEANKYQDNISGELLPIMGGGLRIRAIYYYDAHATYVTPPKLQKYYRYGDLEEGTGVLINKPVLPMEPFIYHYDAVSYNQEVAYVSAGYGIPDCVDRSCLTVEAIEDKTTYRPASYLDYTYANGSPIYYTKVTEYQQDLGRETGKTVYVYYPPDEFMDGDAPLIRETRIPSTNLSFIKTKGLMGAQKSISYYKFIELGI